MTITEIKRWAKTFGYSIIKDKGDEEKGEKTQYYWSKDNDVNVTGVAPSVSKVATAIYNHITADKWIEHQQNFKENQQYQKFNVTDYN
jgi:hypothetical protein